MAELLKPPRKRRILCLCDPRPGATSGYRLQCFRRLGQEVFVFDLASYQPRSRIMAFARNRLLWGPMIASINRDLLRAVRLNKPDIVWFDKPIHFTATTIQAVKQTAPKQSATTRTTPLAHATIPAGTSFARSSASSIFTASFATQTSSGTPSGAFPGSEPCSAMNRPSIFHRQWIGLNRAGLAASLTSEALMKKDLSSCGDWVTINTSLLLSQVLAGRSFCRRNHSVAMLPTAIFPTPPTAKPSGSPASISVSLPIPTKMTSATRAWKSQPVRVFCSPSEPADTRPCSKKIAKRFSSRHWRNARISAAFISIGPASAKPLRIPVANEPFALAMTTTPSSLTF